MIQRIKLITVLVAFATTAFAQTGRDIMPSLKQVNRN